MKILDNIISRHDITEKVLQEINNHIINWSNFPKTFSLLRHRVAWKLQNSFSDIFLRKL